MIGFPNGKINLGLNIVSKREDGYHNIETVFYPITLSDTLEISHAEIFSNYEFTGIEIGGTHIDNICYKAFRYFKRYFNIPKINCHLHKTIPIGAGLGGGSSDGATMIKLLNQFFSIGLSQRLMEFHASKLGADCAFFIKNKPAFAKGIGNEFEKINLSLKDYYIVLVKPPVNISTKEAYQNVLPTTPKQSIKDIIQQPINSWKNLLINDFEEALFSKYPEIKEIKEQLYKEGAIYASMSGSGSAVYGIFDKEINLQTKFPDNYFYWADELE